MTKRNQFISLWCVAVLCAGATFLSANDRDTPEVRAVQRALPSVGNIHTEKSAVANPQNNIFSAEKGRKINGMGTGIVIDERGYLITNYHVIADVDVIRVEFHDKSTVYPARRINVDRENDLALIKIEPQHPLKVMPCGISQDLMLAEKVIAIGNAFGYQSTVTIGYISALGRDVEANETQSYRNLIQTDAAINPGNSGGPLVNLNGEVIGVNVAIRQGAQKIGFAIPIDDARKVAARLMSVEHLDRTYHGLVTKDVKSATSRMLLVDGVHPESPAAIAGLKSGDVILKAGHVEVVDAVDWERAFLGHSIGEKIEISLKRNDKVETTSLTLASYAGGRIAVNTDVAATAPRLPTAVEDDRFHQLLGLKMSVLPSSQVGLVGPKYKGGMRITEVRNDSPASANGIQKGDILVGLDKWETLSSDHINWIITQQPHMSDQPVSMKFYVIRGQETRYGFMAINVAPKIAAPPAPATTTTR